jgi:DMSO reductase anchor subunit
MRPTFSIIAFTVLSGTGYGLWFLLGIGIALSRAGRAGPPWPAFVTAGLLLGFVLVGAGLLSSLGHLGKPARAWRALSQWRTSWLSREGVAAIATFVPATLLIGIAFGVVPGGIARIAAPALVAGALATVYCTAHIYASLAPIRAWSQPLVVPGYALFGLYGGLLCLSLMASASPGGRSLDAAVAGVAVASALLKLRYWHAIDRQAPVDAAHATGLARLGAVRSFEQPHTEENYLLHEMGFVLARKHARRLRAIALGLAFAAPVALALLAIALPSLRIASAAGALASGLAGLFVERWLFFAEAKHAVTAYYQR